MDMSLWIKREDVLWQINSFSAPCINYYYYLWSDLRIRNLYWCMGDSQVIFTDKMSSIIHEQAGESWRWTSNFLKYWIISECNIMSLSSTMDQKCGGGRNKSGINKKTMLVHNPWRRSSRLLSWLSLGLHLGPSIKRCPPPGVMRARLPLITVDKSLNLRVNIHSTGNNRAAKRLQQKRR